ncbi:hypothetical protein L6R50_04850 [Myxococcota bacterium]|nr:hypothetical protein [Myxococcota bacterium]
MPFPRLAPLAILCAAAAGCGIPECDRYCEQQADCTEADIVASGSDWQGETGYPDRAAFVQACQDVYHGELEANGGGAAYASALDQGCEAARAATSCGE